MTVLANVETHSIADEFAWPPQVTDIIRVLNLPLPDPSVRDAGSLLSPGPSTQHPSIHEVSSPPLVDVTNLALSTVSYIRSLVENYGPSRSALPFVLPLIQVLVYMCLKEAIFMKETAFVRPRTTTPDSGVDGIATMLACHIVENLAKNSDFAMDQGSCGAVAEESLYSPPDARPMSVDNEGHESSSSASSSSSTEPELHPMSASSESRRSASGASSIDLPLDAHILPGHGRHLCAVLPFLCIAPSDTAVDLMTSAACQRHVWGITEPVVGLVLNDKSVVAALMLSWFDPVTHVVHIARANDTDPVLGTFDFTSPVEALAFCHFMLNLSHHFAIISECATSCENNTLDWRSDNKQKGSEDFGSLHDRVAQWVHNVQISSGKSASLPPTPPSSPPARASSPPGSLEENMSGRGQSNPQKSTSSATLESPAPTIGNPASSQKSGKALSCSSFANQTPGDAIDSKVGNIMTWLFDRRAIATTRIQFPEATERELREEPSVQRQLELEINSKIEQYNAMCGFLDVVWSTNEPPSADAAVLGVRDLLVKQLAERRDLLVKQPDRGRGIKAPILSDPHKRLLEARLSALLSASIGAFTLAARLRFLKVYEAESRHDWDALFYHFFVGTDEVVSGHVLIEHTIDLARNILAVHESPTALAEQSRQDMKQISDHRFEVLKVTRSALDDDEPISTQALAAYNQAETFRRAIAGIDANALKTRIQRRARLEPSKGKCDVILFAHIPNEYNLGKDASLLTSSQIAKTAKSAAGPPKSSTSPSIPKTLDHLDSAEWLHNPFLVCTNAATDPTQLSSHLPSPPSFDGQLVLPHFTAEYKKNDKETKPLNQGRMYLVSVCAFYSALGVEDYPFFCLVTSGTLGAILMAWKSSKRGQTYIMERNIIKLDLSSPIDALQFATFLLRLYEDSKELTKRVKEQLAQAKDRSALLERLKNWKKPDTEPVDLADISEAPQVPVST
ncbi:hypothetical protein B0H16DRAFT_1522724 [Mycena metata]|uniref:Uncharacterized protein n=1 Tax=Mycena metata TaxID=1033252 RepID=A0AAD7JKN7_9AGAR|nr:hypothetical protein B0H16DRAFT_1522724 [Mycena metata]